MILQSQHGVLPLVLYHAVKVPGSIREWLAPALLARYGCLLQPAEHHPHHTLLIPKVQGPAFAAVFRSHTRPGFINYDTWNRFVATLDRVVKEGTG